MVAQFVGLVGLILTFLWFGRLVLCAVLDQDSRAVAFGRLAMMAVLSSAAFGMLRHMGHG